MRLTPKEVRQWRKAVRPRGVELVDWLRAQAGPVTLSDDDVAALVERIRWLEDEWMSISDIVCRILSMDD